MSNNFLCSKNTRLFGHSLIQDVYHICVQFLNYVQHNDWDTILCIRSHIKIVGLTFGRFVWHIYSLSHNSCNTSDGESIYSAHRSNYTVLSTYLTGSIRCTRELIPVRPTWKYKISNSVFCVMN